MMIKNPGGRKLHKHPAVFQGAGPNKEKTGHSDHCEFLVIFGDHRDLLVVIVAFIVL